MKFATPMRKARAFTAHVGFRAEQEKKDRLAHLSELGADTQELLRRALDWAIEQAEKDLKSRGLL